MSASTLPCWTHDMDDDGLMLVRVIALLVTYSGAVFLALM